MMKFLTITQAAKVTGVSRSTLYRYVKAGKLSRHANGKIDSVALQQAGFKLRDPEVTTPPSGTCQQKFVSSLNTVSQAISEHSTDEPFTVRSTSSPQPRSLVVSNPNQQTTTTSSRTPGQQSPTSDVSLEQLIATLRDELASARTREHTIREAARQEQERLMILLAQEQCNVQQLLTTRTSQPQQDFRATKPRRDVHKGMAGVLLTVTSLFMAFLIFI